MAITFRLARWFIGSLRRFVLINVLLGIVLFAFCQPFKQNAAPAPTRTPRAPAGFENYRLVMPSGDFVEENGFVHILNFRDPTGYAQLVFTNGSQGFGLYDSTGLIASATDKVGKWNQVRDYQGKVAFEIGAVLDGRLMVKPVLPSQLWIEDPSPAPSQSEKNFLPGVYVKEGTGFKTGFNWELKTFSFSNGPQGLGLYRDGVMTADGYELDHYTLFQSYDNVVEPYFCTDGVREFAGKKYLRILPENRPVYADDLAPELPLPTQITVRVDLTSLKKQLGTHADCINNVGFWANYDYVGDIDADGGEVVVNLPRQGPYRYEVGVDVIHDYRERDPGGSYGDVLAIYRLDLGFVESSSLEINNFDALMPGDLDKICSK